MQSGRIFEARTSSPEETLELARVVGDLAEPGDVIALSGDLGAGKTVFAKGFGAALGILEPITSPTFTLAREYSGRLVMHHLDVYRLGGAEEALDLALGELFDSDGVVLIEWAANIATVLPPAHLDVSIGFGAGDDDRVMTFMFYGDAWSEREGKLRQRLGVAVATC